MEPSGPPQMPPRPQQPLQQPPVQPPTQQPPMAAGGVPGAPGAPMVPPLSTGANPSTSMPPSMPPPQHFMPGFKPPPSQPAVHTMKVKVPPGVPPGHPVIVMTPTGEQFMVEVPPGVMPGGHFHIAAHGPKGAGGFNPPHMGHGGLPGGMPMPDPSRGGMPGMPGMVHVPGVGDQRFDFMIGGRGRGRGRGGRKRKGDLDAKGQPRAPRQLSAYNIFVKEEIARVKKATARTPPPSHTHTTAHSAHCPLPCAGGPVAAAQGRVPPRCRQLALLEVEPRPTAAPGRREGG